MQKNGEKNSMLATYKCETILATMTTTISYQNLRYHVPVLAVCNLSKKMKGKFVGQIMNASTMQKPKGTNNFRKTK